LGEQLLKNLAGRGKTSNSITVEFAGGGVVRRTRGGGISVNLGGDSNPQASEGGGKKGKGEIFTSKKRKKGKVLVLKKVFRPNGKP